MTTRVYHPFVSAKSDGGDATLVRPSNWNADHTIEGALPASFIGAGGYTDSGDAQTVTRSTYASVPIKHEVFDTDGFHDNTTNPSRFTIPAGLGGKYLFEGSYTTTDTAGTDMEIYVRVNANEVTRITNSVLNGHSNALSISAILDLASGDFVELYAWCDYGSGGAFNIYRAAAQLVKLDGGRVGSGVGALVYHNTTQTVNNDVILFNSEKFDTDGFHSTGSNTGRLTIPAGMGGKYLFEYGAVVASLGAGEFCRVRLNGSGLISLNEGHGSGGDYVSGGGVYDLAAGDYIEVYFTGNRTVGHASAYEAQAHFSIMRIDSKPADLPNPPSRTEAPSTDLSTSSGSAPAISSSMDVSIVCGQTGRVKMIGELVLKMGAVTADTIISASIDGGTNKFNCGAGGWDGVADRKNVAIGYIFTGLTPGTTYTVKLYWSTTGSNTVNLDGASRGSAQAGSWVLVEEA